LVTKVNGDGTEGWSKIIPKSQYVPASSYRMHSHSSFVLDNKLHIFFNDYYKNYESSKASKIKVFTGVFLNHILTSMFMNPLVKTLKKCQMKYGIQYSKNNIGII
jgi:hypothetical protein